MKHFIGPTMRLDRIIIPPHYSLEDMLDFCMGTNAPDRKEFIINNLVIEKDIVEEKEPALAGLGADED